MRSQLSHLYKVYNWLKMKRTCQLCLLATDHEHAICADCETELPWQLECCPQCALPQHHTQLCNECVYDKPMFSQVIAPWRFDFPLDSLLNRFKHQRDWAIGKLLAQLLARHLTQCFDQGLATQPDALIAVPLSARRYAQRGFNQAELLAQWLSKTLNIEHYAQALQREFRSPQQQLTAQQRRHNVQGSFHVAKPLNCVGQHLAIVDDVMTTGATCREIAQLLVDQGAKQVDVYCLARTPKPDFQPKSSAAAGRFA